MQTNMFGKLQVKQWRGARDFTQFWRSTSRLLPDAESHEFEAETRELSLPGLQLQFWRVPAISGVVAAEQGGGPVARIDSIQAGSLRYRLHDRMHHAHAGTVHLLPCTEATRFEATTPITVLRLLISTPLLPANTFDQMARSFGPLPSSSGLRALVAIAEHLLEDSPSWSTRSASQTVQELTRSLIAEISPDLDLGLRDRMTIYIDQHLTDRTLGPQMLADRFQVSLRWAHKIFNGHGVTIADYIRNQRCAAVAHQLDTDQRHVHVQQLAIAHGFGGRDQLTRAFKAVYGLNVSEYHDQAASRSGSPSQFGTS